MANEVDPAENEETLQSLEEELAGDEEPIVESPDEEESGDEGNEESEESNEEGTEGKEEAVAFKAVTAKYPQFFKDFPNLRHAFFHEREYREIFPTVDDAREAIETIGVFKDLQESLQSGKPEDVANVIKSFTELGDDALPNFANNFLDSLRRTDQDLYFEVMTPKFVDITRQAFDSGARNGNENLKNAALVIAQHLFGDPKVATGERQVTSKTTVKDDTVEKERNAFRQERYTTFFNETTQSANTQLEALIAEGLDPNNRMSKVTKEMTIERVKKEIDKVLPANSAHTAKMNSLWKKANKDNFNTSHKIAIIAAYINAAKEIMPKIRSKVRADVLGIRERRPENNGGAGTKRRIEPRQTTGGGQQSTGRNGNGKTNPSAKEVDWRKTSDLDYLRDNVTLKK